MGYPSLLYKSAPKLSPMELTVFEDLQLLNFIPKSVAKTVKIPCEAENITARQALFRSLSGSDAREKFSRLLEISAELNSLDSIYSSARCDAEKSAVFLALMRTEREFAVNAAASGFGDALSDCFAAAFSREIKGESYRGMSAEIDSLYPEYEKQLDISLKSHGQEIKVGTASDVTYFDRIVKCAGTLGIEPPKVRETKKRRLSPDIITAVSLLSPELSEKLAAFSKKYSSLYVRPVIYYHSELRFYVTMLGFLDMIAEAGIPLTYPELSDERGIHVTEAYDVSLLAKNEKHIVPNDIEFTDAEPFYYLTGANGGGKTTYLRTVGISAVLFMNGCPVPARYAKFGRLSSVFTHFPRDERFDGSGRFVEENGRVNKILERMDGNSLVLLNETYSATNEENAVIMTEKLANLLYGKKIFGLYITHQHSLAESEIPYLNVLIDRNDSNRRTFRIAKQKSTGGSFARDILERYGLTPEALTARFGSPDGKAKEE